jgi:hypothetical protein
VRETSKSEIVRDGDEDSREREQIARESERREGGDS